MTTLTQRIFSGPLLPTPLSQLIPFDRLEAAKQLIHTVARWYKGLLRYTGRETLPITLEWRIQELDRWFIPGHSDGPQNNFVEWIG